VGNLVWTYLDQEDTVELSSDEEDSDSDSDSDSNKSSKRAVNLLEEELHLADGINTSFEAFVFYTFNKTGFSHDIAKPIGQDRTPPENPPELDNVLS
jgi:hypothetical protein